MLAKQPVIRATEEGNYGTLDRMAIGLPHMIMEVIHMLTIIRSTTPITLSFLSRLFFSKAFQLCGELVVIGKIMQTHGANGLAGTCLHVPMADGWRIAATQLR